MKEKLLFLLVLLGIITSCKNPAHYSSHDDPPKGATVVVANPLQFAKKVGATGNTASDFVGVRLKVIVLAADLGSTELVQYSTQSKDFTPNQWGHLVY